MLDKTIDSALQNLRRDLMRNGGEGLEHVEALLTLRGVALPEVRPKRAPGCAGQGVMARMVLAALRHRPMTYNDVARCVLIQRPELTYAQALHRTG